MESRLGELAALSTAVCWTINALAFEAAGRRVGSLAVNIIRLFIGFAFLAAYSQIFRGMALPLDASAHAWFWLSISGLVGFVFGDICLFRAFVVVGSRISTLIMASVPPLTAVIGWLVMGETLTLRDYAGMMLTVGGIAMVVLVRNPERRGIRLSRPASGILLAFGGALGQAVGLVLSKYGMKDYDAFSATHIRIIAAIAGSSIAYCLFHTWQRVGSALRNKVAMANISLGAFFGPFMGVSFSLLAVQHTRTGVAATIMAIVPVLIIAPAVLLFKEKVTVREIAGAVIAVAGVAILFL